jgi:transmembrane sensor
VTNESRDDHEDVDWVLLTRYLTGELSAAERAAVERWFEADPKHRELLDELRSVWTVSAGETAGWNTERAIAALRSRASRAEKPARISAPHGTLRAFQRRERSLLPIAAAIIAMALGGGVFAYKRNVDYQAAHPVAPQVTDVTTRRGQQAEVHLTDGTRVVLGPATRLSYTTEFNHADRTVTLDGEAYFDVVHNAAKVFRVKTARGVAEDIGTAFVMRARGGDTSALQVVVAEGAVMLRASASGGDSLLLKKSQLGRVLSNGQLAFRSGVDANAYLAWTRGQLVFEDASLTEVAADLSRWYDADVRVADPRLALRHFTGQFERRSLNEAVHVVAAVTGVPVRRELNGWTFGDKP